MNFGVSHWTRSNSVLLAFLMVVASLVVLPPLPAQAATRTVNNGVACDDVTGAPYCTIGAAVAASSDFDVVEVEPGTYSESLYVSSATITISSTGGAGVTTITAPEAEARILGINTGDVTLEGFTLTGAARTGGNAGGAIWVDNTAGSLTITDSIVTGNSSEFDGGGILNWGTTNIVRTEISLNESGSGGGVHNSGTMTITDSTITGNTASGSGAGVYTDTNSLVILHSIEIVDSTISGNIATNTGGGLAAHGGATTITGSTISGNTAPTGSGIYTTIDLVSATNSTISGNSSAGVYVTTTGQFYSLFNTISANTGRGIVAAQATSSSTGAAGNVTLARTILAANSAGDCSGFVGLAAFNIVGEDTGCTLGTVGTGDVVGTAGAVVDPLLGTLQDNGGPTFTHLPGAGSVAIDGAITLACVATDQRGETRPSGVQCDIGSVEVAAVTLQGLIDAADLGDVIDVADGTYNELITIGGGKSLVGSNPDSVIIDGTGLGGTVVTGIGDFSLTGIQITGGDGLDGGAIASVAEALVTLTDVVVTGNSATSGAGVYIQSAGSLTVNDSQFDNNDATSNGGAIYSRGSVTVNGSTFDLNTASIGAAIYNHFSAASLTINAPPNPCVLAADVASFVPLTVFSNNTATSDGGAIYNDSVANIYETLFTNNDADYGGALYEESGAGTITVGCSAFELNDALFDGGAIGGEDSGLVVVEDSLFEANTAGGLGGALADPFGGIAFDVSGSVFTGNSAGDGGAIYSEFDLTISDSEFVGNTAAAVAATGGGVSWDGFGGNVLTIDRTTFDGNTAVEGGGVYVGGSEVAVVTNSTFSNNTATASGTAGGGMAVVGDVTIVNSTFSGNIATLGSGAGLGISGAATADVNHSSFVGNDATGQGAAFNGGGTSVITIMNSLAAENVNGSGGPSCANLFSLGYNVLGGNPGGCTLASTDIIGDALVEPLADNTGPTFTHALQATSPAIDAANPGSLVIDLQTAIDASQLSNVGLGASIGTSTITPVSGAFLAGAIWASAPDEGSFDLDSSFSTTFDFQITDPVAWASNPGEPSGDGFTFAISEFSNIVGEPGGRLGAATTPGPFGVVSVEFDTYFNGGDISTNHIGINIGGVGDGQRVVSDVQADIAGSFDDGNVWTAWVDYYTEIDLLEVRVASDGVRPVAAQLSTTVDLAAEVGATGYYGFTGGTGLAYATHTINAWELYLQTCPATDQRGVARPIGETCDIGSFESDEIPPQPTGVSVSIVNDGPLVVAGSPIIPITKDSGELYFDVINGPASVQLGAIQLGAIQLGAIQLGAIQLGAIGGEDAIAYLDMSVLIEASAQLESQLASTQLGAISPTDQITLVDIPIPGGWEDILALSSQLSGRPPYTVTLAQALADPDVAVAVEPLRLFESGITASQLGAIPLEVYALGAIQLGAIQLGAIQLGAIDTAINDLCADIDCAAYGIDPADSVSYDSFSLMSLSLLGADLSGIQLGAIQLGAIDLTDVQLGAIQLGAIDLAASQLGAIQLGAIQLGAIQLGAIQLGAIGGLADPNHPDIAQVDPDDDGIVTQADLTTYWCSTPEFDCSALPTDSTGGTDLSDYSLVALGALGADLDVLQLGAIQLGAIQLGAIDLAGTQLGAIQLGAIDIGASQLGAIQLGAIQLGAIQLGAIQLGAIDPAVSQLGAIQLGAIDLTASQLGAIQLGAIQLGAIQLGAIDGIFICALLEGGCDAHPDLTLADAFAQGLIQPTATLAMLEGAFGALTMDDLAAGGIDIFAEIGTATIADLYPETTVADLPSDLTLKQIQELVGAMTIFDLLIALMNPSDLAWEDLDPADLAEQNPVNIEGLSTQFTVNADPIVEPGAALPFTAEITLEVPAGMLFDGSASLAEAPLALPPTNGVLLDDPIVDGNTYRWVVDNVLANTFYHLSYSVSTFITVADGAALRATVTALGETGEASYAATVVELEPNDTFPEAILLGNDVIVLGFVDSETDIDLYELDVPAGAQVQAFLNGGGKDLDLVLFEPENTVSERVRGGPEAIVDGSLDPIVGYTNEQDPEQLADIPNTNVASVFKASAHRGAAGEQVVTPPLATPGQYFLQVTGYNGATNVTTPYSLRVKVVQQADRGPCDPRVFANAGAYGDTSVTPSVLPPVTGLPLDAQTLFLVNEERYAETHGALALTELQGSIANLLTDQYDEAGVLTYDAPVGAVIPINQDSAVEDAYLAMDADRCDPFTANVVVGAIADLVDTYRAEQPGITSIVLVGGDDLIPFARVRDNATIANEREYANEFTGNNEGVAALAAGMVLTDDPYADANPLFVIQGKREVFVPQFAVGRLVETPLEIKASLDQFVFSGGYLDVATQQTATVFSYDFLADMGEAIVDEIEEDFFPITLPNADLFLPEDADVFISETWTAADWATGFGDASALISTNAHYDHNEGLPALSNGGASADLFGLDDVPASLAGSIIYSVGCHSGFNAPGAYMDPNDENADWAQVLLGLQAVYIANTGFGYGDDTFIGYSEALMVEFTRNFSEVNTVGEAFSLAKQARSIKTFAWSPYDDKALMESTLYGLPFYRIQVTDVVPPNPPAPIVPVADATGQLSTPIASSVVLPTTPTSTDAGEYFATDTLIQVPFRPIEPGEAIDVTADNLLARGAIVTNIESTDIGGFDAAYARAVLYSADAEPEVETDGPFPTVLHQIRRGTTLAGERDFLLLTRGRFFPSSSIQRIYDSVSAEVYYADPLTVSDLTGPEISRSKALELRGDITFTVTARDPENGIARVAVLYKLVGGADWNFLDLAPSGGDDWTATVLALGGEVEYWVQVLNDEGLVNVSSDKGELHIVELPGPPSVTLTTAGSNGWTVGVPVAIVQPPANAPTVGLEYSFDGGATFTDVLGSIDLPEGLSELTVRPEGIAQSEVVVNSKVDTVAPTVTITTPANHTVGIGSSFPLTYTCTDATSGISSCKGPKANGVSLDTSALGTFTVTVQGVDKAGNKATARLTYTVVDHAGAGALVVTNGVEAINVPIEVTASYGGDDTHTLSWDWGDGTVETAGDVNSHAYIETGVYTVTVTVTHSALTTSEVLTALAVVYDPADGFVTGGGWFNSPLNAYTPNNSLDAEVGGVAEFGFVSKYKKGATVPTGNTVFELVSGDFEFHSRSYDWLVVTGARAKFEGTGIISSTRPELDAAEYKFRITLRDADINTDDAFEQDSIRVKIWEVLADGTDWVVYDSGRGSNDDETEAGMTLLGGGSIKIHVPKGKAK